MSSKNNAGKWDFPGGKVDLGESFQKALLREVVEETGLTVSLERVVGHAESSPPRANRRIAYIIMEGKIDSGKLKLSGEHDDKAWISKEQLAKMKDLCPQFHEFAHGYSSSE